eukprot:COSAG04_NODE_1632_length_6108_cov_12.275087_4_plen_213_part_00
MRRKKRANYGLPDTTQRKWCGTCAKRHGGVLLGKQKMCEDCKGKHANYGLPDTTQRKWCFTCAKTHGGVLLGKGGSKRAGQQKRRRAPPAPASESSEEDDALGNDGRPSALDSESSDEDADPLEEAPAAGSGLLLQRHPNYIRFSDVGEPPADGPPAPPPLQAAAKKAAVAVVLPKQKSGSRHGDRWRGWRACLRWSRLGVAFHEGRLQRYA